MSGTRIFARGAPAGEQVLVYQMTLEASGDLAMILPLPVPPRPSEDALHFIDLEGYPSFFGDLDRGFEDEIDLSADADVVAISASLLAVRDVGAFEASFVPTVDDFDRLDPRFRLPREIWSRIPPYRDFGFAVFKLRDPARRDLSGGLRRSRASTRSYHAMAFRFPRRDPRLLFFPTLHIHDGTVHPTARFDHLLYCQSDPAIAAALNDWLRSTDPAGSFLRPDPVVAGLVDLDAQCYRRALSGEMLNRDIVLGGPAALDATA